jgi:hypothetical protein
LRELEKRLCSPEAVSLAQTDRVSIPVAWTTGDWVVLVLACGFMILGMSALVSRVIEFVTGGFPYWRMLLGVVAGLIMILPLLVLLWGLVRWLLRGGALREIVLEQGRIRLRHAYRTHSFEAEDILGSGYSGPIQGKGCFVHLHLMKRGRRYSVRIAENRVSLGPGVLAGTLFHRFGEWTGRTPNTSARRAV